MKFFKSFFCDSDGRFMPPYFWITFLMIGAITMVVMRFCNYGNFSDNLILGVLALVVGWCGVYNYGKRGKITDQMKEQITDQVKEAIGDKAKSLTKKIKGK